MTDKVFRHEARHINDWQRGNASRHKLRFFKKPASMELGKQKQLVNEIRAARYGYEPYIHFIEDYDREDISRLGLVGLSEANEQLDLLEKYLTKSTTHARILTMVQKWRHRHFTSVYNLHVNVRTRLPEWKSTVLEARETSAYGGHWHLGVRVVSWFKKAWPEAEKIIKAVAAGPNTKVTPLGSEEWGYLTEHQVTSLLKGSCLNAPTRTEVGDSMAMNIIPQQVATLFFTSETSQQFTKGLENIDLEIRHGISELTKRHGLQTDGQDMGFISPIGSMIVPESEECAKTGRQPSAVQLWGILESIKSKSSIYPVYMIKAPHITDDAIVDKKMGEFRYEAQRGSSLTPDDLGDVSVNLSGVETMTEFNDYIGG